MSTAFDRAAAALFGNADLAAAATLYPAGDLLSGVAVQVILSQPDQESEFGESRVRGVQTVASLLVIDAPALAKGDVLAVGGVSYTVAAAPERDAARTTWRALLAKSA